MSKKNVLIFAQTSHLAHLGGPLGYLNTLRNQLKKHPDINNIHFIEDGDYKVPPKKKLKMVRKVLYPFKRAYIFNKMLKHGERSNIIENCNDDFIHFHYTGDLFKYRNSLKKYKGKVILTSHSPTLTSMEIISSLSKFERLFFKKIYSKLIEMDIYSFEHADYIIFPCQEAEEPYIHAWRGFEKFRMKNAKKFKYLLTGVDFCKAKKERKTIRRKYNISDTAFVVSYVGRHNEIKGYDKLKKIGRQFLNNNRNSCFLIAGTEGPIQALNNNRWIEIGWTKDPYSIINASDVFVLPNKETYFDIIFLEVLSLGKTIVASRTGGNKYFEKFKDSGIYLYDSIEECEDILNKLSKRTTVEIKHDEQANLKIYEDNFTSEKFLYNYEKLIQSL